MKNAPERLTDLPNVGPEAARWLVAAGIRTPAELRRRGAVAAAAAIRRRRPDDPPCRSLLAGLDADVGEFENHGVSCVWISIGWPVTLPSNRRVRGSGGSGN